MSVYQVMPPLTDEERAALRDEIERHGVLVPIVTDQHGNVIDGHNRKAIADELGVPYRVDVREVTDEEEARSLARMFNLARRHLSRSQKRQLIADEITADPDRSDREIARLMGCDHKTVGSVRRELSGEFPHPDGPLSADEETRAREAADAIRTGLNDLDATVLRLLAMRVPPETVVGYLRKLLDAMARQCPDEEFLGPVRQHIIEPRVAFVREHGEELSKHADPDVPVPTDAELAELQHMLTAAWSGGGA